MYIAIDIGGTNIRIASFSSLTTNQIQKDAFAIENSYEKDLEHIVNAIKKQKGDSEIKGIGISLAGVLNKEKTMIAVSAALSDWVNQPFSKDLAKEFGCDVVIENDATAAALGEAVFGQGKNKDFLYIIWGTGIGGTAVKYEKGDIVLESFEPGHQIVDWKGEICTCGQKGCLELLCSGGDIEKKYKKTPHELSRTEWSQIVEDFAHGIINTLVIRPVSLVILSGGVISNNVDKISEIHKTMKERLKVSPIPELVLSSFGENSGIYGALALLNRHFQSR